jgi:hypothetical protein
MKFRDGVSATATYVNFPVTALFPLQCNKIRAGEGPQICGLAASSGTCA